jgi:hypothetical protein
MTLQLRRAARPAVRAMPRRSTSPRANLGSLQVPMIFLQGTQDYLVNLEQVCFKRAALAGIESHYFGTDGQQRDPADVCGGNFSTAALAGGTTRAAWPQDRYLLVLEGQGHGFTGDLGNAANALALGFVASRLGP